MMYIWELLIQAKNENRNEKELTFCFPQRLSPYQELSFENINTVDLDVEIDVNPYYRFYHIFKDFFMVENFSKQPKRQKVLYDLIIHFLAELDCYQGMTKREYHIGFVIRDIYNGIFGKTVKEEFHVLPAAEQKIIANNILRLYKTGEGVYLFLDTVLKLYRHASVLANAKEKDLIVLFLQEKETPEQIRKIQLLNALFLPFKYEIEIYWEHLFGVIGADDLMRQGKMILY